MIIDWFTVIAQIVNFLILVALLKHFLFNRVVAAMHERKMKIDASMDDARKREDEARNELEAYREKSREFEVKKEEMLRSALEESRKKGDEYLLQIRKDAEAERARLQGALEEKKRDIAERLRMMSLHDAVDIASRTLLEITGTPIEEGLVNAFIGQLKSTGEDSVQQLREAVRKSGKALAVRSSFALSEDLKNRLSDTIRKELPGPADIVYQHTSEKGLVIEMDIDGYRLHWGTDRFLKDAEDEVARAIAESFGKREEKHA